MTEVASISYRAYLRKCGVSYILAGKAELDCEMAMGKLHRLFHIERLLICGGGAVDWTFLQADMVDELSLVLSPVTSYLAKNGGIKMEFVTLSNGVKMPILGYGVYRITKYGWSITGMRKPKSPWKNLCASFRPIIWT